MDELAESFATLFSLVTYPLGVASTPPPPPGTPVQYKILVYADDPLVFLRDTTDLLLLRASITTYVKRFNALLNYSKIIAMSLSGRPKPEWRAFLASHNIRQMHDRTSPDPVAVKYTSNKGTLLYIYMDKSIDLSSNKRSWIYPRS